ncbi:MAG: GNAT family N-acetyltransferase [Paracoccaceae bacterium]
MLQEKLAVQPAIAAGRFVLRPLRAADAGPIARHTADPRVAEGTRGIPHPLPPGTAEAFVAWALSDRRDGDVWAIDASALGGDEVLGIVSLTRLGGDQSEVRFWVAPEVWNAGYASEAVQALVAANPHGSRTLFAEVFQDQAASARVLSNAGFAYLGDAETFSVARGAARVPTWTYIRRMG